VVKTTGCKVLIEALRQEGVEFVFGLPGTSNLSFLNALEARPEIRYILGLHETVAVGIAEGYARFSGKVGVVNLHSCPGLSAAMPMLYNSFLGRVPLVVTAGEQAARTFKREPDQFIDLAAMASHTSKWSTGITRSTDLSLTIRKAFKIALQPPAGPVFVSLPQEIMNNNYDIPCSTLKVDHETKKSGKSLLGKTSNDKIHSQLIVSRVLNKLKHQIKPRMISYLLNELKHHLKSGMIVVEESPSNSDEIFQTLDLKEPSRFFHLKAGSSIGCGLPIALGAKLASPESPVLAIIGDGGAIWSIQSLWTAAHYNLPVTILVMANGGYNVLKMAQKEQLNKVSGKMHLGLNFNEPRLDFCKMAQSMGVVSRKIEKPEEISETLREALGTNAPYLIEVNLID
jgi:thiamine pyrophosphate-dependent acetolactate synthase large subunit-like protein